MSFTAPVKDMLFCMEHLANLPQVAQIPGFEDASLETAQAVLEESAKLCEGVIEPLNVPGDTQPSSFAEGKVVTTPGFKEAYQQYVQGGWQGLQHPVDFGGQGLPKTIGAACVEMLNASNISFALCPLLTDGAIEALLTAGSDALKAKYLEKLVSGEWTGTMNLTEPQAGSDLALVRTKAEPLPDGTYKIFGTKIFITYGEHDMAENIIHLVLARVAGAPEGVKGISLFVVPKYKVNADGSLGERNAIYCGGLEHKMGIKANATAQIVMDSAVGEMVGQPNKGLQAMFVMMNAARLGVGNQSLGLTEVAYQNALAYAKDRLQMRSLSGTKAKDKPADPIIVHPDVRRMLLTAKAYAEGGRALSTFCGLLIDKELNHPDEKVRKDSAELVALLTPIVKAFLTDNGWISTTAAQQVFGGHGFIKEWGMEQFVRDNRINMIYEGTNGIQALDLLGRKVLSNQGATLKKFGKLVAQLVEEEGVNEKMAEFINPIAVLGEQMTKFTTEIGFKGMQNPDEVGAAAVDYLRVAGHLVFGYFFARMAQVALRKIAEGNTDSFYQAKLQTARFYFARLFPETASLMRTARAGSKVLMDTDAALL